MSMKWEILKHHTLFQRFFRLDEYQFRHDRFEGGQQEVVREVFERGNAAAVLPYDALRDEVVLIEQFRPGAVRFRENPWLLEVVAGVIETGEESEDVARREALEEAGVELGSLIQTHHYLVSPGGTSESCTVFVGSADTVGVGGFHGLEAEGEDIKVHVLSREKALQLLESGEICNAVTVIALQWLALNYQDLQNRWGQ